jgi:hypothetical protein
VILLCTSAALLYLFANDVIAKVNAFVANENRRSGNQFADFVLALATERAIQQLAAIVTGFCGFISHPAALALCVGSCHRHSILR